MTNDVNEALGELQRGFAEFKKTHEQQIAEMKRAGGPDPLIEEKLKKIGGSLDDLSEQVVKAGKSAEEKSAELEAEIGRLRAMGGPGGGGAAQFDVKSFNAHRKSIGITGPDVTADEAAAYGEAFVSFLRKGDPHTDAERKTLSVGSEPDGGYLVTPNVSGRLVTRVFETSLMRLEANSQTIGTDALEGGRDIGEASAGWVGETDARVVTNTPQIGVWRIPTHEMYAMPDATQKMLDDANMDVEGWLAMKVGDKFSRMENAAFVTGSGSGQPRGFTTYPTVTTVDDTRAWGQFQHVATGVSGDWTASNPADKLMELVAAMKAAYLANAKWYAKRLTVNGMRKFKDSTGQYLWQPSVAKGVPDTFLGYDVVRMEDMPTIAANSLSVAFGDMRQTYQIVDRAGVRVLRDPYTAKPFVRFYTSRRVGGDVLHFETLKFLKFA